MEVRHEAADGSVLTGYHQDRTQCATTGPYQDVRPEQSDGAKLLGQRNLTPIGVAGTLARGPDDC
jgi:hypothetical protein